MARPKKDQTNTTSVVEQNEKTTEVEQNETPAAAENTPAVDEKPEETPETKPEETKPAEEKPIKDDDKVIIKCAAYAGKSIVLLTRTISLDEKGCCEVTGIEAKRLLIIPGYERA
jgi:hypothetical protein